MTQGRRGRLLVTAGVALLLLASGLWGGAPAESSGHGASHRVEVSLFVPDEYVPVGAKGNEVAIETLELYWSSSFLMPVEDVFQATNAADPEAAPLAIMKRIDQTTPLLIALHTDRACVDVRVSLYALPEVGDEVLVAVATARDATIVGHGGRIGVGEPREALAFVFHNITWSMKHEPREHTQFYDKGNKAAGLCEV